MLGGEPDAIKIFSLPIFHSICQYIQLKSSARARYKNLRFYIENFQHVNVINVIWAIFWCANNEQPLSRQTDGSYDYV